VASDDVVALGAGCASTGGRVNAGYFSAKAKGPPDSRLGAACVPPFFSSLGIRMLPCMCG
jgi:hypothetical protein